MRPIGVAGSAIAFRNHACSIGRVVRDDVDDQSEAELVRVRDERVEVGERAELRVDVDVVGDVVAVVVRRGEG